MSEHLRLVRSYFASKLQPVLGPDARRYLLMADGTPVVMPFQLRWLLPATCGADLVLWWCVWLVSFPVAAAGMVWWAVAAGHGIAAGAAAGVLLVGLSGFLGVKPVETALPSMALGVLSAASFEQGWWLLGIVFAVLAATIRESAPVWIALWVWNPIALVALAAPILRWVLHRPHLDEVTANSGTLLNVHDAPVWQALVHQDGRWRDAYLVVVPWGVTIAALYRPSWQLGALLVLTYAQLLVTTDYTRLLHSAAGPAMALGAAVVIPAEWLLLAVVVHVVWWRAPVKG
jgi:hypothetical protein